MNISEASAVSTLLRFCTSGMEDRERMREAMLFLRERAAKPLQLSPGSVVSEEGIDYFIDDWLDQEEMYHRNERPVEDVETHGRT